MKYVIYLTLILVILSGCGGGNERPITDIDIYTGNDGLKLEFLKNSPPDKVLENQNIPFAIKFDNQGAYSITNGYIAIINEEDYINIKEWSEFTPMTITSGTFNLEGKTESNPLGDNQVLVISAQAEELEDIEETHTVLFAVNACYGYKTYFGESICIDTSIYDNVQRTKSCEMKSVSGSSGQGAPVGITSVEPTLIVKDENSFTPRFKVEIKNLGNGEVLKTDKIQQACSSAGFNRRDFNEINILSAKLSDDELICSPNPVELYEGKATTFCELESGIEKSRGTYSTLLTFELDYGYTNMATTNIEIRKFI